MPILRLKCLQTLAEILSEREMICHLMENILDEATRPWGVKVERVEIKVKHIGESHYWALGISGNILGWTGQVHSFIGTLLATALYNFLLKDPLRQFIQCFCFLEGRFCLAQCQAVRGD